MMEKPQKLLIRGLEENLLALMTGSGIGSIQNDLDGMGAHGNSEEYEPPASWHTEVKDFLSEHLTGFLLQRGLDANERANVLAAIRGQCSVATVERALKEQWSDEDLMKRDKAHYSAHLAWEDDEEQVLLAGELPPDPDDEPKAYAAFMDEQNVIDSALEAIKEKKRTLQEARWRRQQVRSGRKFHRPTREVERDSFDMEIEIKDLRSVSNVEDLIKPPTVLCPRSLRPT